MARESNVAWLRTHVASRAQARRLARGAVAARLAACANLVPIESIYRWEGRVRAAHEVAIVFKTDPRRLGQLRRWVEERHPYEVPYLAWSRAESVPGPYARWATAATAAPRTRRRRASPGRVRPRTR